jgi:hypothetical protein
VISMSVAQVVALIVAGILLLLTIACIVDKGEGWDRHSQAFGAACFAASTVALLFWAF